MTTTYTVPNVVNLNIKSIGYHIIASGNDESGNPYISFDDFKNQVEYCKNILSDCIKDRPSGTSMMNINVILGKSSWGVNVLGEASRVGGASIRINQYNTGFYDLNDISLHQNISVIIHEIIHVLGLFHSPGYVSSNYQQYYQEVQSGITTRRYFKGPKGLKGYEKVLLSNNIKVPNPIRIYLEDDFEEGTVNVHLEEAYEIDGDVASYEVIKVGGQFYPTLHNEIMTGLLNSDDNYITPITMGCLDDFGYTINYESAHILSNGYNMNFVNNSSQNTQGTSNNYFTMEETIYDLPFLNKVLKSNTLENETILLNYAKEKWGEKI